MSSDYNISYSYSLGNKPKRAPAPEPKNSGSDDTRLYAFGDCQEINLPTNAVLLVSKNQPVQSVVTRDVAIALNHCTTYKTLQGHAEYLTAYMPELGGDVDGVRTVLESVRDSGLMSHAAERLSVAQQTPDSETLPASKVFIITCDRPAAVERLLESMLASADLAPHESLYLVDDSRDAENALENRKLVENFNLTSTRQLIYFGKEQRQAFINDLITAQPEHEAAIRFLLDHDKWQGQKTYGLSRTICLLLSVGCRAIMLDDDVICSAIDSPYRREGTTFFEGMCEADFYPSQHAWKAHFPPRVEDPLRGHLNCLGLSVGGALMQLGMHQLEEATLSGSQQAVLSRLSSDSKVLVTQNGTFGDPGTEDTAWCFSLTGDSRARLLDHPETLEAKIGTRQYWMGWSQPTFAGRANMSQVTGLDNSTLLPPYFPAWRGEDQLFGTMVDYIYPDSMVLNYPWAVPHMPFEEREGHINVTPEIASIGLVENFVADHKPADRGLESEQRLAHLVGLLRDVALKSDEDLAAEYRSTLATDQANAIHELTDQMRAMPEGHTSWKMLLEARRKRYFTAIGRRDVPIRFAGVPENTPESALWSALRNYCSQFADCLEAWSDIRAAAKSIHAEL